MATVTVDLHATPTKVWQALTDPATIKQYFFGVEVSTDWKVGSPILYRGTWNRQPYEEKGVIQKNEPEKLLQSTYWSASFGTTDSPENYQLITYVLTPTPTETQLTLTQENVPSEKSRDDSQKTGRRS